MSAESSGAFAQQLLESIQALINQPVFKSFDQAIKQSVGQWTHQLHLLTFLLHETPRSFASHLLAFYQTIIQSSFQWLPSTIKQQIHRIVTNQTLSQSFKQIVKLVVWLSRSLNHLIAPRLIIRLIVRHLIALILLFLFHILSKLINRTIYQPLSQLFKRIYYSKSYLDRINHLNEAIDQSTTYEQWQKNARLIDRLIDRSEQWKNDSKSDLFDWRRILDDLQSFRRLVDQAINPDINQSIDVGSNHYNNQSNQSLRSNQSIRSTRYDRSKRSNQTDQTTETDRSNQAVRAIMSFARSRLHRNLVGINDRRLYSVLRSGTKRLIEEYIAEVVRALQLVCQSNSSESLDQMINQRLSSQSTSQLNFGMHDRSNGQANNQPNNQSISQLNAHSNNHSGSELNYHSDDQSVHEANHQPINQSISATDKLAFFNETRHAFGRTALLLSGGSTLGLYHTGVVKALHDNLLLPRVLSGASVGAIVVAMVGTRTDEEIKTVFTNPDLKLDFFPSHEDSTFFARLKRLFTAGQLCDIKILEKCVRDNIPDLTFAEAYDRSGRIINIVVSPSTSSGNQDSSRLLNYLTAPNVLVWSAVLASCAIPGLFHAVELQCKDDDGRVGVWIEGRIGVKWEDGSVRADLPMERLRELFNINHFIVSQVNPHVIPFLSSSLSRAVHPVGTLVPRLIEFLTTSLKSTLLNLIRSGIFPSPSALRFMLDQTYVGDITLVPPTRTRDFMTLLTNPTPEHFAQCLSLSEKATFSHLAMIRGACEIEMALDDGVRQMRAIVAQEEHDAINRSISQSINQLSKNHSAGHFNRVRSWSTEFTSDHHTSDSFSARRPHTIIQSNNQSIDQSTNHSSTPSLNQSINRSINQSIQPHYLARRHSESINQSIKFRPVEPRGMSTMDLARLAKHSSDEDDESIDQQSISRSVSQPISHSSDEDQDVVQVPLQTNQQSNKPLPVSLSFSAMPTRSSSAAVGFSRMTRNLSLNELANDFDSL